MSIKDEIKVAARKFHAKPTQEWRQRLGDFSHLLDDEASEKLEKVRDTVYGIVLDTGADLKTICQFFGWDFQVAKQLLGPTYDIAKAELKLCVLEHLLNFDMNSKIPLAKIHMGRHFADQTESGQPLPTDEKAAEGIFTNLVVVETHRDINGQTIQEPSKLKLVKTA